MNKNKIVAIAAGVLLAGAAGCGTGSGTLSDKPGKTADATTVQPQQDPTEPSTPETDPSVEPLSGTWIYTDNVSVSLSRFSRGITSEYASPNANVPYVGFYVTTHNNSKKSVDMSETLVDADVGGTSSEQVFDENLSDPSTHLLPGHTYTYKVEFEAPKSEHEIQIEVAPGFDYDAAIFSGAVR